MKQINVNDYSFFQISQVLPSGYSVFELYTRIANDKWVIRYSSNAQSPICPFHGDFRKCENCDRFSLTLNDDGTYTHICDGQCAIITSEMVLTNLKAALRNGNEVCKY